MTVIGLTGGIASGKSTAAEMLRELGATVIDADRLGHRSYEPGTPGFTKVVNAFGHDVVGKDGYIDRRVLGGKVFGAPEQLERLNSIVWPEIRTLIREEIAQIRAQDGEAVIVLEAAVLLEARWQDLCDEIWVITTPVDVAVDRLRMRNAMAEDAAMARINSQMSNEERSAAADVTIENAGTEDELREAVEQAWEALGGRHEPKKPAGRATATKTTKAGTKAAAGKANKPAAKKPAAKASPSKPAKAAAAAKAKPTARGTAKPAKPAATAKASPKKAVTKPPSKSASRAAAPKSTAKTAAKTKPAASKPAAKKSATVKSAASKAKPAAKASAKPSSKPAAKKPAAKKPAANKAPSKAAAKPSRHAAKPKAAAARKSVATARTAARKTSTAGTSRAGRPTARSK